MMLLPALVFYLQTAQQTQTADAAFRAGYSAMAAGELGKADAAFAKTVRLTPKVAAGHSAYGAVLLAEGKSVAAVSELELAHRLDAKDAAATENLAAAYTAQGRYAEAVAAFRALGLEANLAPDRTIAFASALARTGDLQEATERLRAASLGQPEVAILHDALGTVLAQQAQYEEAQREFERAVALEGARPGVEAGSAHGHLGALYMVRGNAPRAMVELQMASRLDPANAGYLTQLGRAQTATREDEAAVATLRRAHEIAPRDPMAAYELAVALQNAGRSEEALPLFADAVKMNPKGGAALTNYALALVQTGDAARAILLYVRALAVEPDNPTLREDLGVAYLQQSDLDRAMTEFRAGLVLPHEGAPLSANLHYDLGLALKLKDKVPEAIAEFKRAAALDPSLPDPPYTLGILYMQTGRFEDAANQMERAVAARPENGEAWSMLGNIYKQMEQPEKAVVALRRAIPLLPGQPSPHITLAALLAQQGDREGAAAERKIGAELSRVAVSRQKAEFALKSGRALLREGKVAESVAQLRAAVAADPGYVAAHRALGEALLKQGNAAEAALERQKSEALGK